MHSRILPAVLFVVLGLGSLGCTNSDTKAETESVPETAAAPSGEPQGASPAQAVGDLDPRVEKALAVAKAIEATPDRAEEILARHELSAEEFEDLLYEISMDPTQARQYVEGLATVESQR